MQPCRHFYALGDIVWFYKVLFYMKTVHTAPQHTFFYLTLCLGDLSLSVHTSFNCCIALVPHHHISELGWKTCTCYILKGSYSPRNCSPERLSLTFLLSLAQTRYYHEEKLLLSDGHSMFHCFVSLHVTDCQWGWTLTLSRLVELKTTLINCR